MKRLLCFLVTIAIILQGFGMITFAQTSDPGAIAGVEEYLQYSTSLASDGSIGIPIDISTYYSGVPNESTPVIMYVINTNTERIGTESDTSIVSDLIKDGYIVVVVDYKNNQAATSPDLDWSLQQIRTQIDENSAYLNGAPHLKKRVYILPAGYRIERNIIYWNIKDNGGESCLQYIVDVWNGTFTTKKGNSTIKYSDGSTKKVKDIVAASVEDCVKPDGTPIDLNLYMDIMYPSMPKNTAPVMCLSSSAETSIESWTDPRRPHLTGYLFGGYAGVIYDHMYTPMARDDHYGYFDDGNGGPQFTLVNLIGIKAHTAAMRCIRYLSDRYPEKYKFTLDKFGSYGHSKGSQTYALAAPEPEKTPEDRTYKNIEVNMPQPWLTYESNGEKIPSNIQMVYTSNGGGASYAQPNMAPVFVSAGEADGTGVSKFVTNVVNVSRAYDTPCMYLTMPGVGHTIIYGHSDKYDIDMYKALFDFTDYYLKDANSVCEYITPLNGTKDVGVNDKISIKFTGPISKAEAESKIKVVNTSTGELAIGEWTSDLGDTTWEFCPRNLKGGHEYKVIVPANLVAKNGKTIKEEKSVTFKTSYEKTVPAKEIASDGGNLIVTKEPNVDEGVYFVFNHEDFENSTTTALRFGVKNDAAQTVSVYAVESIDKENIKNSVVGEKLGSVVLFGSGDYELDVTDYVKSLDVEKEVAFLIKADKEVGTKTVTDVDFESSDARFNASYFSGEQNNTSGGSTSYKVKSMNIRRLFMNSYISNEDFGRKFHVSVDVYPKEERAIVAQVVNYSAPELNYPDWHNEGYSLVRAKANTWNTMQFDYQINDKDYCRSDIQKDGISIAQCGGLDYMYIDNLKVTEEITNVEIETSTSDVACAPSLVLHPATQNAVQAVDVSYVESGDNADKTMDGEFAYVNGRRSTLDKNSEKTYVKLSLAEYPGGKAYFGFRTQAEDRGAVEVYGIADKHAASNWSSGSINSLNAPANLRNSFGVNINKVYGNAPIKEIMVNGADEYSVDISEYAEYMKRSGSAFATLVFVNATNIPTPEYKEENFDGELEMKIYPGGGLQNHGQTKDEDHTGSGGSSYYMSPAEFSYERLRFDILGYESLTKNDIGRKFRLTYWVKANAAGQFFNSTMAASSSENAHNRTYQTIETANIWQKCTYEFTLTEAEIVNVSQPKTDVHALINFEMSGMGVGAGKNIKLYIDDMTLEEISMDGVTISPVVNEDGDKIISTIDFDNWDGVSEQQYLTEVNDVPNAVARSGFATMEGFCSVASDVNYGDQAGKSFLFTPQENYNRIKFYNIFDHNLTEKDLGRKINITFKAKSNKAGNFAYGLYSILPRTGEGNYPLAEGEVADTTDWASKLYPSPKTASFTAEEASAGLWKTFSLDVTVDETMLPKTVMRRGDPYEVSVALLGMASDNVVGAKVYLDDIIVTELARRKPYMYNQDFETVSIQDAAISNGCDKAAVQAGGESVFIDYPQISTKEHYGLYGTKSLELYSTATYNRFKILNTVGTLTREDIGKTRIVNFYMKANKTGTFTISMMGDNANAEFGSASAEGTKQILTVKEANTWTKYSYKFSVTEQMVTNNINCLTIMTSGFGQSKLVENGVLISADPAILYIDNLESYEESANTGTTLAISESASIRGNGSVSTTVLKATGSKNEDNPPYIRKTYFKFLGGEYENTQKAVLSFTAEHANGQNVKIYALENLKYPDELTYSNAPANIADEGINENFAFGSTPVATLTLNNAGTYTVDVTKYVKNNAPNEYIFVIASDTLGGSEYTNINFKDFSFTPNVDYTAFGNPEAGISVIGEEAVVEGLTQPNQGINILNAFGNGTVCSEGETYTITADITPVGEASSYDFTIGLSNGGEVLSDSSATHTLPSNIATTISLEFTATADDIAKQISAIAMYGSSNEGMTKFKIDNIIVKSEDTIRLSKVSSLTIETAAKPDISVATSQLTVSAQGEGRITASVDGQPQTDWATGATNDFARGTRLVLTAVPDADSKFLYWIDKNSGRMVSQEAEYAFYLGTDHTLEAVFANVTPGVKTVVFRNKNGQVLLLSQVLESGNVIVPQNPEYMGYQFTKWIRNGIEQNIAADDRIQFDALADGDTLFQAGYVKTPEKHTVTVTGGTLYGGVTSGSYTYDTNITVTLDNALVPSGKKFSHWTKNGAVVSYEPVYTFYMGITDAVVEAVYADAAEVVRKQPVLTMSAPVVLDGGKIAFFSERSLDAAFTMVETGILLCSQDIYFDIDTEGIIKARAVSKTNNGQYTIRKANVGAGESWYAKAYMLYRDENGALQYLFSDRVGAVYPIAE